FERELTTRKQLVQGLRHALQELGREAVRPDARDVGPALGPAVQARYFRQRLARVRDADDLPEDGNTPTAHFLPQRAEDRVVEHVSVVGHHQCAVGVIQAAHAHVFYGGTQAMYVDW